MADFDLKRLKDVFAEIGSEERLRQIMDRFYQVLSKDVLVGFYFDGKDVSDIAEKQGDFLLRAMGQTKSYTGKPPAAAHLEIAPILVGHFDRRLRVLEEILKEEGLSDTAIQAWVEFESLFRDRIQSKISH